ncbi:MAG: hypothetical protein KR126chlam2_00256 [Chlamydiae bacterium]|nr:hypothetical protein [Chlamydiota bacterium]
MVKTLNQAYLDTLSFGSDELSTLLALGEYRGKQELFYLQSPETLKTLQQTAVVESTESSNRLEGIIAPHKRIADLVLKDTAPKNRSEEEIAGYRDALSLLHQSAKDIPLSINVILQLHDYLYRYHPAKGGEWKQIENEITEIHPDGTRRVRFKPVSPFETPRAMEELVKNYSRCQFELAQEPLIVIPAFILDFLCIHPFRDGNGRTARLLTLLLLYQHNYEVGRYISLERIFEESKDSYYETLEESSKQWHEGKHNFMPWLTYFWGVLLRAYREFEKRVGVLTIGSGSKTELIRNTVQNMLKSFSISDIERACPSVSRDMIRVVLRELRNEGKIQSTGKGRGAKWKKTSP